MTEPGPLASLIGDQPVATFLETVWGREVGHFPQRSAPGAGALLTLDDFEAVLATLNRAHEGWLHLADQGLKSIPSSFVDSEGMLDMERIGSAFAAGQTIYLTKAERVVPALADLCAGIAGQLARHGVILRRKISAHVFLTPPRSQGFSPHRDEHASFILQLEGSKEWTIYAPPPGEDDKLFHAGAVDQPTLSRYQATAVTLHPGDVLYMPEWWPHEARAAKTHSLHATLRMFPFRWYDLLEQLCREHPAFAKAVPAAVLRAPATLAARLRELLDASTLLDHVRIPPAPAVQPAQTGRFRDVLRLEDLTLDTPLVRAEGITCQVHEEDEIALLSYPGGTIRGPGEFLPVFRFVAQTYRLRARELPSTEAHYDRIEVAKRLVRDGLMRVDGGSG